MSNPAKIDGGLGEAKTVAERAAKASGLPQAIWQDGADFYVLPAKTRRRPTELAEWVDAIGPHQLGNPHGVRRKLY